MPVNEFFTIYSWYVVDRTKAKCYIESVNPSKILGIKKSKKRNTMNVEDFHKRAVFWNEEMPEGNRKGRFL